MKKIFTTILMILGMTVAPTLATMPVYAEEAVPENCVSSSVLSNKTINGKRYYCDDSGDGAGVFHVLGIVLNVLTFGIGIAATVGIVISGIQYATAGDNSSRVQAAKNRILQIVIGLAIYAVFWGILQFLLPGGLFGDGSTQ